MGIYSNVNMAGDHIICRLQAGARISFQSTTIIVFMSIS